MKRLITCVLTLVLVCQLACNRLTSPDGDDIDRLEATVQGFPPALLVELKKWAANRFTAGYIRGLSRNNGAVKVGTVYCEGGGKHDVHVRDVLECLDTNTSYSYRMCLNEVLHAINESIDDAIGGAHTNCDYHDVFTPQYAPDELPDEADADRNDHADIVRAMIEHVPPLAIQAAIFAASRGGAFGPKGVLCPMAEWGCPDNPSEPGIPQQPPQGDR